MTRCDDIRGRIGFYLDEELGAEERERFEAHVSACAACRTELDAERVFLERVRTSGPLYTASEELRDRVSDIVADVAPPFVAPRALRDRVDEIVNGRERPNRRRMLLALAASIVAVTVATALWLAAPHGSRPASGSPSEFALMAVDVHQRYVRGSLPLEIATASPIAISHWFSGKVPFGLELPNYQEASGQDRLYELEGARLVGFNNDYAAYVAYQMGARPISLVVTSSRVATASGGEEIASKGLTFHFDVIDGLKVITWTDRGLTYALVSDLEERGQQSCVVCHQGTRDRDFIEGLKPAR